MPVPDWYVTVAPVELNVKSKQKVKLPDVHTAFAVLSGANAITAAAAAARLNCLSILDSPEKVTKRHH